MVFQNLHKKRVCEPGISKCLKLVHSYYESVYWVLLIFEVVKNKIRTKSTKHHGGEDPQQSTVKKPRACNTDDCYTDL